VKHPAGPPMTLENMRAVGVRHVMLSCTIECGHHVELLVDDLPAGTPVQAIGRRYRCSLCGRKGPQSQPAWHLQERGAGRPR
jgi:hypothetical protein